MGPPRPDPARAAAAQRARRIVLVTSRPLVAAGDAVPAHRMAWSAAHGSDESGESAPDSSSSSSSEEEEDALSPCGGADAARPSPRARKRLHREPSGTPRWAGRHAMTQSLMAACGLLRSVRVVEPRPASVKAMERFHDRDYLECLALAGGTAELPLSQLERYGLVDDAAPFPHVDKHCAWVAGASLTAAEELVRGRADVAINWAGGRHHAGRRRASGFCFVNDVVLSVLELQRAFHRVLVLDVDVHHGDAVEHAFYHSPSVLTVSLHLREPGFFPGSGAAESTGEGLGEGFNVNVPLARGESGAEFLRKLRAVLDEHWLRFAPGAVVLVCGADALRGDPRGGLLLSAADLEAAVADVLERARQSGCRLLVLGGGGYRFADCARAWARVTALLAGARLPRDVPEHDYFELYGPDWLL